MVGLAQHADEKWVVITEQGFFPVSHSDRALRTRCLCGKFAEAAGLDGCNEMATIHLTAWISDSCPPEQSESILSGNDPGTANRMLVKIKRKATPEGVNLLLVGK